MSTVDLGLDRTTILDSVDGHTSSGPHAKVAIKLEHSGTPTEPGVMDLSAAKNYLRQHNVKFVLAQFVDIHGVAKAKSVPVSHFEDILGDGAGFAGFAMWGFGMQPHDADYMARGELGTLSVIPWQPGYARLICTGYVKNKPWPYDTRWTLGQQMKRLAERGLLLNTGLEPEFMLLQRKPDGTVITADESDCLDKPCYDYKGLSRSRGFIEKLVESLQAVGIDVYQIDHEDANGQFEINFTYSDAITSADRIILIRMAAGEIAREMGIVCTFMPKPRSHMTGSGMHMHLSLSPIADGKKNLFHDASDARNLGLSKMAYQFIGGLLKHSTALAALCAPSVNSYKRLVVGRSLSGATWAPAYVSYGDNNRTSMVRVPYGRLELRLSDSSCNPYLATAAVIAAGLDGIDRELDPGEPHNFNHYDLSPTELSRMGIGLLPQSLHEAVEALEKDVLFAKTLGPEMIGEFITIKRMEWVEYSRYVSDWEVNRYLQYF
jgi:glutamine synthetase